MAAGSLLTFIFASAVLSSLLVLISSMADSRTNRVSRNTTTITMFLPLFLHSNRRKIDAYPRRQLHNSSHRARARMFLRDGLLVDGYYTCRLWIGTPPQTFALIVDTGSTLTYVPCATCEQCGEHQDPKFQPDLSSTYQPVKCNTDCLCDSDKKQCTYERQYAELSSSSGVLGDDIVSFGNQSELKPQRAVFGCENMETGDIYSQHADGIMGLGRGDFSIMDQLAEKGVISDSFSMCYGGMDVGGGAMVLGGMSSPADMIFTRSDPLRSPYYNIELTEMRVAGKVLPLDPKTFDGNHGTVLDSGTTYAYLPESAFGAFKTAHLKMSGSYCLGIFQNGKDPTTFLGGIIFRNTLVTYDRENERIGFWKTNCSELWERHNVSVAPLPPPLDVHQTAVDSFSSSSISTATNCWPSTIFTFFLFSSTIWIRPLH